MFTAQKNMRSSIVETSIKENLFDIVVLVISIAVFSYFAMSIKTIWSEYNKKLNLLTEAEVKSEELRVDNLKLWVKYESVLSDDNIEKQARDRMHLARKNEKVFVIDDAVIEQFVEAEDRRNSEVVSSNKSLDKWISFFNGLM